MFNINAVYTFTELQLASLVIGTFAGGLVIGLICCMHR